MKNKTLIALLFILFAIPIPVSVIYFLISFVWFLGVFTGELSFPEIISTILRMIISASYLFIYVYALKKTRKEKRISTKTFLPIVHCLFALMLFVLLIKPIDNYADLSAKHFGFAKKDFVVVEELDTHGGFQGEGSYYLTLDCSNNIKKSLKIIKDWNKLPLSESLNYIMYGEVRDGLTYGNELAKKEAHIPEIKNGYYMFEDRHSESKDSKDDTELLDRHSYNFSIAIYDCDTNKMYYFEYDS